MLRIFFRTHFLSSLIALTLLLTAAARGQERPPLGFAEALEIAAERSQALVAQEAAAAAARDRAIAAAAGPDPVLTAGIDNLPVDGPDAFDVGNDFMTMRSIGFMRDLTRGSRRDLRSARFEREAEAADAERSLALADLQRETAVAWLGRYHGERMREVLAMQRVEGVLQVDAADVAYRSGLGAQVDVFSARSALAALDDRIAAADRDVEIASIRLARWIGDAAARPLAELPAMDAVPIEAANLETELAHHPMLAVLAKREEVARAEADVARADKRPDWSVAVMYSLRGADFSDMVSVSVSRPLQWRQRDRQDRELAASLALAESARAEREEETRAHLAETLEVVRAWQANCARLERYAGSLLPLASERTGAAVAAYRGGSGTLEAVLDARMNEIDVRLDELALRQETAELWAALEYLIPVGAGESAHGVDHGT